MVDRRTKGPFKRFQHLASIRSTKVERSFQTVSMPFNIFKKKENVESMLIESLNQFKFDSTHFQQAFNNIERPVQTPPTFGSTTVLKVEANVETV